MKNIHYTTLAAVRLADPVRFDRFLTEAITAAVDSVGRDVLLREMRAPHSSANASAKAQKAA